MLENLQGERYKIIAALGGGGFGQIYVAQDTHRPGNPKCIVKHLQPASRELSFLQLARRLFNKEAEILEKLGRHGQIPQLLAYFEENEEFYLVQEFIEGKTLSDELESTQLNENQVISLLEDILQVLDFVHSHQVIHRDIKPSNIIRRHSDGKLVLIDFGAVKEIRSQIVNNPGQSEISVAIGTKGYMPNEQSAGKPRFNSDIYALGIIAIQALTGLRPSKLPEDPNTAEIIWRDRAKVSNQLADIIDKMVRYDFRVRYQSTTEVLQAIRELNNPTRVDKQHNWKKFIRNGLSIIGVSWFITTGLVLGIRELKLLQPLELATYDRMMRLRFAANLYTNLSYENNPTSDQDPRLLVVSVDEEDIKQYNYPLTDATVNQLLSKLQSYQPAVIGLNIFRPTQKNFAANIKRDNIVGICTFTNAGEPEIAPPPNLPSHNVGFNDVMVDDGAVVRRALLFAKSEQDKKCTAEYSFAMLLAINYFEQKGIPFNFTSENYLQLGKNLLPPLGSNSGGYRHIDARGYQILLDYRAIDNVAQQVSLSDVLNGRVNPNLVKDRIVIIGTTSLKLHPGFSTPYSPLRTTSAVLIHAQVVSQILSTAINDRPLLRIWSEERQLKWIAGWALAGGILAWLLRSFLQLVVGKVIILLVLILITFSIFTQSGWVPLIAPTIALVVNGWMVAALRLYINKHLIPKYDSHNLPSTISHQPLDTLPALSSNTLLTSSGQTRIQGHQQRDEITRYYLTCNQGQQLTLQILEGDVNLKVIDPDGETLVTTIDEPTRWEGMLAISGDYIVEVFAAKESRYVVDIDLKQKE